MGSFPETYNDPGILGGGAPPGYPISDQKMSFCTPVFRPGPWDIMSSLLR